MRYRGSAGRCCNTAGVLAARASTWAVGPYAAPEPYLEVAPPLCYMSPMHRVCDGQRRLGRTARTGCRRRITGLGQDFRCELRMGCFGGEHIVPFTAQWMRTRRFARARSGCERSDSLPAPRSEYRESCLRFATAHSEARRLVWNSPLVGLTIRTQVAATLATGWGHVKPRPIPPGTREQAREEEIPQP